MKKIQNRKIVKHTPKFIKSLTENEVFVFGSNLQGFHGAGSAGFAMRGTTKNDWRTDKSFCDIVYDRSKDRRGLWAVYGIGQGFQEGHQGKSYAIATVERPGYQGRVTIEHVRAHLERLCEFAEAHSDLTFFVVKLGATRAEGGYSYLGQDNIKSIWKDIYNTRNIPGNIVLPEEQEVRQEIATTQEHKKSLEDKREEIEIVGNVKESQGKSEGKKDKEAEEEIRR